LLKLAEGLPGTSVSFSTSSLLGNASSPYHLPKLKAEQIARVEGIIKYRFQDHENAYLWEALQMVAPSQRSVTSINGRVFTGNNHKLAIIGDAVMAIVIAEYWFSHKYSVLGLSIRSCSLSRWLILNKPDWDDLRKTKLSNQHFNNVALKKDLISCTDWKDCNEKVGASLVEALMGAIFLDSGRNMNAVRNAMISLGFTEVLDEPDCSNKQQVLMNDATANLDMITLEHEMVDSEEDN
ncbi:unnamed protein product, partial [Aureobasidium vineae]